MRDSSSGTETGARPSLADLIAAPEHLADLSITEAHSMTPAEIEELHLGALQRHFAIMSENVPALARLAEEHDITRIDRLEDAGPLLMAHSVYKSYPLSVLEEGRFDQLTSWLNRLTVCDLSGLDAAHCGSIDEWIDFLDANTSLRVKHSSGTTGKLSFVPRSVEEYPALAKSIKRSYEGFGDEPDTELDYFDSLPIVSGGYRWGAMSQSRMLQASVDYYHGGNDGMALAFNQSRISADLLSIGGRIRAAEERGELGALKISPMLLARREAFIEDQKRAPERMNIFMDTLAAKWGGGRVILSGSPPQFFDMAELARAKGLKNLFAPGSLFLTGGGGKGRVLPEGYEARIAEFLGPGNSLRYGYGMSEMVGAMNRRCPQGNYHLRPNLIPYLLDPKTGDQYERRGTQTGRFGFVDLFTTTHWGGFVSGDEVTLAFPDSPCPCGRTGAYLHNGIRRYSEKEGGDDKITCAGAPEAHDKALAFISQAVG